MLDNFKEHTLGSPSPDEGNNGDMTVRYVGGMGLFLFHKWNDKWYSTEMHAYPEDFKTQNERIETNEVISNTVKEARSKFVLRPESYYSDPKFHYDSFLAGPEGLEFKQPVAPTTVEFKPQEETSGATINIDWRKGNKFNLNQDQNTTIVFKDNPIKPCNLILMINHAGGSQTISWGCTTGKIYWVGGGENDTSPPTHSSTIGMKDMFAFYFNGTNYYGVMSAGFKS